MAEIAPIEKFPHVQLIEKAKINTAELDNNLRVSLADFNKRYTGYKLKGSEDALNNLMAFSNLLFQNIYDYYVDPTDQNVALNPTKEITPTEIKEAATEIKEEIKEEKQDSVPVSTSDPAPAATLNPVATTSSTAVLNPTPTIEPVKEENIPTNKNEKALYDLHKSGTVEGITIQMLKDAGFNTGFSGPLGVTGTSWIGNFKLQKSLSDRAYKLLAK